MMGDWRPFFVAIILVAVLPAASSAEEAPSGIDPSLVIEQFDVFNDGDALLVPVKVFGKSRLFLVDTGCTHVVYDERLRPQLGEALETAEANTATGKLSLDVFNAPAAKLGHLDLQTEEPVPCIDLGELREELGHDIEGLVGISFLREYVVHLDFEVGTLSLLKDVPANAGKRTYLVEDNRIPMMRGQIKDAYGHFFTIDTGFMGSASLSSDLFEYLAGREAIVAVTNSRICGAAGGAAVRVGYLAGISLDECELAHIRTHANPLHDRDNSLGMGIWSRFNLTFDFPHHVVFLKPNRNFGKPFLDDIDGMAFIRKDGFTVVRSLDSNGPAAKAGIHKGDHLLEIDELDATTTRLFTLQQKLSLPGTTVHVKLKRDDEIVEVDLKLPEREETKREVVELQEPETLPAK